VRSLYAAGVDGLYVNGSSGEGLHLEETTRMKIAEVAVALSVEQASRDGEGRAGGLCVIHVGAAQTAVALRLAKHARAIGATAVSSLPPFVGGSSYAETLDYYRELAAVGGLPVLAYHIPSLTKVELSLPQLLEVAAIPGVCGFKFTGSVAVSRSYLHPHVVRPRVVHPRVVPHVFFSHMFPTCRSPPRVVSPRWTCACCSTRCIVYVATRSPNVHCEH
jgi:dihydrodipicolinate synthase/N-acetylneuraminate lyase